MDGLATVSIVNAPEVALLMSNGDMADPLNEWAKALAEYPPAKRKTEEAEAKATEIEFNGALYFDDNVGVFLPSAMILKAVSQAATQLEPKKYGKNRFAAMCAIPVQKIKLHHDGPADRKGLASDPRFRFRKVAVTKTKSRIVTTRPRFDVWSAEFNIHFDRKELGEKNLRRFLEHAGLYVGIGSWRPLFGKFTVESVKIGDK